jgi:hypothetical protein|tara:strand:- start:6 stop:539 length:534 start_codon:yes stop_codon:yes gene_type:complete
MKTKKSRKKSKSKTRKSQTKKNRVGNKSGNRASFAAKLAAFICENQDFSKTHGNPTEGFNNDGGKQVTGVLPFLHLNINEKQFTLLLDGASGSLVKACNILCNKKNLNKKLKSLGFNCKKNSSKGINNGLLNAISESIHSGWKGRKNGRRVISFIENIMRKQEKLGIIPKSSIKWAQ